MGVVILLDIMMERIFAFWYYRKYDESSNNVPCAAVILLVAQYTVFLILGFSVTQDWVSFEALILVLFTLSILTYVVGRTGRIQFLFCSDIPVLATDSAAGIEETRAETL
ncbi:hypothetical protein PENTCL1PPCAC_16633 [Pristionchus entomophagus]|uniref:G protein-coupled receptor n=1 Tax=Pristionchus entomophagus TaxID=358040 RepID=A0AAV5TJJ9_9BILA|nr:hypothetical protein PENTCL1PPCAC_16633 [Pristionchus entomophagus]